MFSRVFETLKLSMVFEFKKLNISIRKSCGIIRLFPYLKKLCNIENIFTQEAHCYRKTLTGYGVATKMEIRDQVVE